MVLTRRSLGLLGAALLATALVRAPFLWERHREGDEVDAQLLADQLVHGRFTLKGVVDASDRRRKTSYVEAELYHGPPLFHALLAGWSRTRLPAYGLVYLIGLLTSALVFLIAGTLGGERAAVLAVVALLACPIAQVAAGKIWTENLVALLVLVPIAAALHFRGRGRAPSTRELAAVGAVVAAAMLTKQTAILAIGGLAGAAWLFTDERVRRRFATAVLVGAALGGSVWALAHWWVSGSPFPGAVVTRSAALANPFVQQLRERNPLALLYMPIFLWPVVITACVTLLTREDRVRHASLWLTGLGVLAGMTVLAHADIATYHTKYIAPAMPALAVLVALGVEELWRRRRWEALAVAGGAVVFSLKIVSDVTLGAPRTAEVFLQESYRWLDFLPW